MREKKCERQEFIPGVFLCKACGVQSCERWMFCPQQGKLVRVLAQAVPVPEKKKAPVTYSALDVSPSTIWV